MDCWNVGRRALGCRSDCRRQYQQGSEARFRNLLKLVSDDGKEVRSAAGRVIFRTKDKVTDWKGKPLFPAREIKQPTVVQLGMAYETWYFGIGALYDRPSGGSTQ